MEVQTVLVDNTPANFRSMLAALQRATAISFEDQTITSSFHTLAPEYLPSGKLNLEAMVTRIGDLHPAVAIIDMRLQGDDPEDFSGVDLSLRLKAVCPDCCIILISSYFASAPELVRYLEVFRNWVDRTRAAELYAEDLQQCYAEALKTYVGSVRYRHGVNSELEKGSPRFRKAVFISYAWRDEWEIGPSREEIVDRLDTSLLADGYDVRRDKRDLPFKASISEFAKELGRADCVVTVISDKYLRSRYCMAELQELYNNLHFRKRIFPIILPEVGIAKFPARLAYVSYWQNELKQLALAIRKAGPLPSQASYNELCLYKAISENVGTLLEFLADIKYWTPPLVEVNNFADLKQSIGERLRELD